MKTTRVEDKLKKHIRSATLDLGIEPKKIYIEYPKDETFGSLATTVAMTEFQTFKTKKSNKDVKSPFEFANVISNKLKNDPNISDYIESINVAQPGFINFSLKKKFLVKLLTEILIEKDAFGSSKLGKNKSVIVEYSSPNIAKPFTIGHFRSTIIGDSVANILEFTGWKVYRDNHLGDWGTQFGKQIYAIKKWGDEKVIEDSENPVKELVNLYIKFHEEADKNPELNNKGREWFKKLEDGDEEAKRLWKKCIDWSMQEFNKIYSLLGVKFTENNGMGYGESFFEDKMKTVINELKLHNLLSKSEGAHLVFFKDDELPPLMILKKDGATLYSTRDLATDKFRLEKYGKDVKIINEVGIEQSLYFKQLYKVEKQLGWIQDNQRVHLKHGHFRFKDTKMSTRKGKVIWLEEVILEAIQRAYILAAMSGENKAEWLPVGNLNENETFKYLIDYGNNKLDKLNSETKKKQVKQIAIGALKWNDLKRDPKLDVAFDWEEILNMTGNSGPYIQYTYARCKSVLSKSKDFPDILNIANNMYFNNEELKLLNFLYRFPKVVSDASLDLAPHVICTYLFELGQRFNSFYNQHSILNAESEDVRNFRLALTAGVAQVLENGLGLLGIEAPERM